MKIFKETNSTGLALIIIGVVLSLVSLVIIGPLNKADLNKISAAEIIALTNEQRSLQGQKPLSTNLDLMNSAQKRAESLAKQLELDNYIPNQTYAWDYLKQANYPFLIAGENIAIDSHSSQQIIDSWVQSITHKNNLVNSLYNDVGVGIAKVNSTNNQSTNITVALFASQTSDGNTSKLETTFPAGPIYVSASSGDLTSKLLLILSFTLILIGGIIEYFQIKKYDQLHNQNNTLSKNK